MYQFLITLIFSFSQVSYAETQAQLCDFDSNIELCTTAEVLEEVITSDSDFKLKKKLVDHLFSKDPENEVEGEKILQTLYEYSQKEGTPKRVRDFILSILDENHCENDSCNEVEGRPPKDYLIGILDNKESEEALLGAAEQLVEHYGEEADNDIQKILNPFIEDDILTDKAWLYLFELQSKYDLLPSFNRLVSLLVRYQLNQVKRKAFIFHLEKSHHMDIIRWASASFNNNGNSLERTVLFTVDSTSSSAVLLDVIRKGFDFSIYEELILRSYPPVLDILLKRIADEERALYIRAEESKRVETLLSKDTISKVRDYIFANNINSAILTNLINAAINKGLVKHITITEQQFMDEGVNIQLKTLYLKQLLDNNQHEILMTSFFETLRNYPDVRKLILQHILLNAPSQFASAFFTKLMSSNVDNYFKQMGLMASKGVINEPYRVKLMINTYRGLNNNLLKDELITEIYKTDFKGSQEFLKSNKRYIVKNIKSLFESLMSYYRSVYDNLFIDLLKSNNLNMYYKKKIIKKLKSNGRVRSLEKLLKTDNRELLKYILKALRKVADSETSELIKEMLSHGEFHENLGKMVRDYLFKIEKSVQNRTQETIGVLLRSTEIGSNRAKFSDLLDQLDLWQRYFDRSWRPSKENKSKFSYRNFLIDLSMIESSSLKMNLNKDEVKNLVYKIMSTVDASKGERDSGVVLSQGIYSKAIGEAEVLKGSEFVGLVAENVSVKGSLLKQMLSYLAYKHLLGEANGKKIKKMQFNALKKYARKNRSFLRDIIVKLESEIPLDAVVFIPSDGERVPTPNRGVSRYIFNWADTYVPRGIFSCPESSECVVNIKGQLEMDPFSMFTSCPVVRDNGRSAYVPSLTLKANNFKNVTVDTSIPLADGSCGDDNPIIAKPIQAENGSDAKAWEERISKTRAIRYCALHIIKKKWGLKVSWCADHKTRYEPYYEFPGHIIKATNGKTGYKGHDAGNLKLVINESVDVNDRSIEGLLLISVGGEGGEGGKRGEGISKALKYTQKWVDLPSGENGVQGIGGHGAKLYLRRHNSLKSGIRYFSPAGNHGAIINTSNKDNFGGMGTPTPGNIIITN